MSSLETLVANITRVIINPLIILLFAIALLVFVWGVVEYIIKAAKGGDDFGDAKRHLFWGVIGMFIMVAVKGIMVLIMNIIGV